MPKYQGSVSYPCARLHFLRGKCRDYKSAIETKIETKPTKIHPFRSKTNAHINKNGFSSYFSSQQKNDSKSNSVNFHLRHSDEIHITYISNNE